MIDITKLSEKDIGRKVEYKGPRFLTLSETPIERIKRGILCNWDNQFIFVNYEKNSTNIAQYSEATFPGNLIFIEEIEEQKEISRTDLMIFE